ncbi:hypothetical protein [Mycoplasma sp. SG1]|uniref:hypothetical protein n=1 Tax=Mycoplasma sp. SG1 TaxID=2810348 RepID=UPI00202559F7|nr:hypothetical protein [Mycoplasma sp. SG1]URM53188.1 hypothetical protein JRW51_02465 [Mycoplasma sp. SG1]
MYHTKSVASSIIRVSLPTALSAFLAAAFGIIDEILAIKFGTGKHQLIISGYNLSGEEIRGIIQVLTPLYLFITSILFAGATSLSNSFGLSLSKGEKSKAYKNLGNSITVHFMIWVGYVIFSFSFMNIFLKMQGLTNPVLLGLAKYMAWLLAITSFLQFFSNIFLVVLKIRGWNILTSLVPAVSFAINIALDLVFLIVYKYGLFGTAIATAIAIIFQFYLTILVLFFLKTNDISRSFLNNNLKIDHNLSWNSFLYGISSLIRNVWLGACLFFFNIILAISHTVVYTNLYWISLFSIVSSYMFVIMGYISGFVQGVNIFIIQNIGRNKSKRVRDAAKLSIVFIIISALIIEAFLLGFSDFFVSIYLDTNLSNYHQSLHDAQSILIYSFCLLPLFGLTILISSFYESIFLYIKSIWTITVRCMIFLVISLIFLLVVNQFTGSMSLKFIFLSLSICDLIFILCYIVPFYFDVSQFQVNKLMNIFDKINISDSVNVTKSIIFHHPNDDIEN